MAIWLNFAVAFPGVLSEGERKIPTRGVASVLWPDRSVLPQEPLQIPQAAPQLGSDPSGFELALHSWYHLL